MIKHTRDVCEKYSIAHQALNDKNLYCYFKASKLTSHNLTFGSLKMSNDKFFVFGKI